MRRPIPDSMLTAAFQAQIMARVTVESATGCWTYPVRSDQGYGRVWMRGKAFLAHAVTYTAHRGTISADLQLDHLCRNRACVNPSHLEPVTNRENTIRGAGPLLARARGLAKAECVKGHPLSGDNILVNSKGHRICRTCKREWFRANGGYQGVARSGPLRKAVSFSGRNAHLECGHVIARQSGHRPARLRCAECDPASLWPYGAEE